MTSSPINQRPLKLYGTTIESDCCQTANAIPKLCLAHSTHLDKCCGLDAGYISAVATQVFTSKLAHGPSEAPRQKSPGKEVIIHLSQSGRHPASFQTLPKRPPLNTLEAILSIGWSNVLFSRRYGRLNRSTESHCRRPPQDAEAWTTRPSLQIFPLPQIATRSTYCRGGYIRLVRPSYIHERPPTTYHPHRTIERGREGHYDLQLATLVLSL